MKTSKYLCQLVFALTIFIGAGSAWAGTAAARDHSIYNDRQGWALVDRDRNGRISAQEWKWAEKHGYDRLNGVPKKHLTRDEYQRYLSAYLGRRNANAYRPRQQGRDQHIFRTGNRDHDQRSWYVAPRQVSPWTYGNVWRDD